jgi:hypothetical protein
MADYPAAIALLAIQRLGLLCVLLLPISAIVSTESLAQYLTGSAREDSIKGTANGCMRAKINDAEAKNIPNSLFEGHCRCYANALADRIKVADMQSDNKAVSDPIVKAAALTRYLQLQIESDNSELLSGTGTLRGDAPGLSQSLTNKHCWTNRLLTAGHCSLIEH